MQKALEGNALRALGCGGCEAGPHEIGIVIPHALEEEAEARCISLLLADDNVAT